MKCEQCKKEFMDLSEETKALLMARIREVALGQIIKTKQLYKELFGKVAETEPVVYVPKSMPFDDNLNFFIDENHYLVASNVTCDWIVNGVTKHACHDGQQYKLTLCDRKDLKLGDWALRGKELNELKLNMHDRSYYSLILGEDDFAFYWNKKILKNDGPWKLWWKIERADRK